MPVRMSTNWENAFLRVGSDPPIKLDNVVCTMEESKYAEDEVYVGIDFSSSSSETYTFDVRLDRKQYKNILRLVGRGNNWRRMHGKKLIRIPLNERRFK